jgi:hypothetical protein
MILFLIIFIAVWFVPAFAQPQAPITWGPVRVLYDSGDAYSRARGIYARGDTLVLLMDRASGPSQPWSPTLRVSSDNGQSWGPWRSLSYEGEPVSYGWSNVAFTSTVICCCADTRDGYYGFYTTTDLGQTWHEPVTTLPGLHYYCERADTLFCKAALGSGRRGVTWTGDVGQSFSPIRVPDWEVSISDLAVSRGFVHAVDFHMGDSTRLILRYARAPLYEGAFEPPQFLNTFFFTTNACHILFDEGGTGMILSPANYRPPGVTWSAIFVNVSRDDGFTWSLPDTFTPFESAGMYTEGLAHSGPLWLGYWCDSTRQAGFATGGVWCRFTANWGRSWYPGQQVEGIDWMSGTPQAVQVDRWRARVRVVCMELYGRDGTYFLQWEGQVDADSLPPAILQASMLPERIPADSMVEFAATAFDDDSLWLMQVVVRRTSDGADSTVVSMERTNDGCYIAEWQAPADTGQYVYYYRAEDMWEHVDYQPEAGPAAPWVVHVGAITAVDPLVVHPSAFVVSVSPNPANSVAVIELQLPSFGAEAQIEMFDLLGRRVYENTVRSASGSTRLLLDASSWPSGLYFVKVSCGARQVHQKVLVLK